MKKTLTTKGGLAALAVLALFMTLNACTKEPRDPGRDKNCREQGTLREHKDPANNCFVRLIEEADGSLLEPIDQKELYETGLEVDGPVLYSYEVSNYRGTNCTNHQAVKLSCIKGVGE